MSTGSYGTNIPISIKNNDIPNLVDITYSYHESRSYDSLSNSTFKKLDSSILTQATREVEGDYADNLVEGMYNLQLPLSEFNKKGFYTVYIKPKEIEAVITDVGNLTAFPNVRGLVIDTEQIQNQSIKTKAKKNNELVGYRIVYLDENGNRQDYYRIITSNNKCEPVVSAPSSSSDKTYTYRYEDSSSLTFVTVSPSSAPTFKSNALPYIGKPTQKILLVNTLFEPIQLDIELTTHDADTISYMLENSQLRDLDNGLVTTYNDNDEIYHQKEHYTLKDGYTGKPIYEVAKNKENSIDFSQTIDDK
jgi:hypothetical protein